MISKAQIKRKKKETGDYTDSDCAEKVKQLKELNQVITHNLRGGVSNISMLTTILTEKKVSKRHVRNSASFMSTSEGLQYIHDSSASLLGILNDLMEIARIHLDDTLPYDDCDIASMVQNVTDQLQAEIRAKNARIGTDLQVRMISCPKAYLQSILYNLISNSLKYARKNVIPIVDITTRMEGGVPVLTVKDNGLGIDLKAYGGKIFKLNQTFHKGYDSKGVGLYITKTQVESVGGTIAVKSKVNEGSEFTIHFKGDASN